MIVTPELAAQQRDATLSEWEIALAVKVSRTRFALQQLEDSLAVIDREINYRASHADHLKHEAGKAEGR